jgi:hypothetical protein
MWKWFLGFILVLFLLKGISSCSMFKTQPLVSDRPDLSVVPADQLPKLQQNGIGYKPKYVMPQKELPHVEDEDGFEPIDEELMLSDHATD